MVSPSPAVSLLEHADYTDEAVVEHILDGDSALFELLMRRYNERLYRAARHHARRSRSGRRDAAGVRERLHEPPAVQRPGALRDVAHAHRDQRSAGARPAARPLRSVRRRTRERGDVHVLESATHARATSADRRTA